MKHGKRFVSFLLAMVMVCSLMVNAGAAEAQEEIKAQLSYDITVSYNGETQALTDAAGNTVYPISYNGTTYLPVRAVSYVLGIAVDWDGATQTVLLSDGEAAAPKAVPASNAPSGSKDITAQLDPGITVKYNGEVQTMTDAAGNTVYPVSYNGTTYLPVRAVSNMLGVAVDWDGTTQTVILGKTEADPYDGLTIDEFIETYKDQLGIKFNGTMTVDEYIVDQVEKGVAVESVKARVAEQLANAKKIQDRFKNDPMSGYKTSEAAKVLSEDHIGYDYAEIDWSTANDGYFRVLLKEQFARHIDCSVTYLGDDGLSGYTYELTPGKWTNMILNRGSRDYAVTIQLRYSEEDFESYKEFQNLLAEYPLLRARFTAEITNPDTIALLSHFLVDFESAPSTCAKALEITKSCKTDAEKIATVYEYVSKALSYDYDLMNVSMYEQDLNLDHALESKKGVSVHYVGLMAAMLRSMGIPCKCVRGYAESNGSRSGHIWLVVPPDIEGLDMSALGAGKDPSGWIRLDPLNAGNKAYTSNDSNYDPDFYY